VAELERQEVRRIGKQTEAERVSPADFAGVATLFSERFAVIEDGLGSLRVGAWPRLAFRKLVIRPPFRAPVFTGQREIVQQLRWLASSFQGCNPAAIVPEDPCG
jgi:hypothetical protein